MAASRFGCWHPALRSSCSLLVLVLGRRSRSSVARPTVSPGFTESTSQRPRVRLAAVEACTSQSALLPASRARASSGTHLARSATACAPRPRLATHTLHTGGRGALVGFPSRDRVLWSRACCSLSLAAAARRALHCRSRRAVDRGSVAVAACPLMLAAQHYAWMDGCVR